MPDQVPGNIQRERFERLAEIARRLRERFFQSLLGQPLQVLVESETEDNDVSNLIGIAGASRVHLTRPQVNLLGTSARYAPIELPSNAGKQGELVEVTAQRLVSGRILAVR